MKKEIADLWTEALRSGEYTQGQGALQERDTETGETIGHCCLGVLCDIAIKHGLTITKDESERRESVVDGDWYWTTPKYDGEDALLPNSVRMWAGMRSDDGTFRQDDNSESFEVRAGRTLADLNDSGTDFARIAELIDTNYNAL